MRGWLSLPWRSLMMPPSPFPIEQAVVVPPATPAPVAKPPGAKPVKKPPGKIVLVTVLGLQDEALATVIETVKFECTQAGTRPLFITDGNRFDLFRSGRSLVEQVVDVQACRARSPERDWSGYGALQYRLIGRKWKPITAISFGRQPDPAFLEAAMQGVSEKL